MDINLYEIATQVIGPLPAEYHFVYGLFIIFMVVGLVFILMSPFLLLFKVIGR